MELEILKRADNNDPMRVRALDVTRKYTARELEIQIVANKSL